MKKLIVVLCVVLAAVTISATSIMATVAYLTSSAAVSNVFTIGNVGITMTESKVNADGTLAEGGGRVDTNTYHLVPNTTYIKDPTIHVNAGSEDSYLFVAVRNDIEAIACDNPAHMHTESCPTTCTAHHKGSIASQMVANGWRKYTQISTGWVYLYVGSNHAGVENVAKESLIAGNIVANEDYKLFDEFSIDEKADTSKYGAAKITLTAFAIQKAGFVANGNKTAIDAAWDAVVETYTYLHTGTGTQG